MKIVLPTINPPYYENTAFRKSYISVVDGIIKDDIQTMINNQNNFFSKYFTNDESKIADNFNITINSNNVRTVVLEPSNYPDNFYKNDYEFWNNVSYIKIINDDFIEYCFITQRKCNNLANNSWVFVLQVDYYNTYWIKYYNYIINSGLYIDVERYHAERFEVINFEEKEYIVFNFLTNQDNAFWNKESFEQTIKSKLTYQSGLTLVPWEDKFINVYDTLHEAYSAKVIEGVEPRRFFDTPITSKGFPTIVYSTSDDNISQYRLLRYFYGYLNIFYFYPMVNNIIVSPTTGELNANYKYFEKHFGEVPEDPKKPNRFYLNAYHGAFTQPNFMGIIYTPKPICLSWVLQGSPSVTMSYPNRDGLELNYDNDYVNTIMGFTQNNNGSAISTYRNGNKELGVEPLLKNRNSKLNALCDERIPFDFTFKKFIISDNKLIQDANFEYEPKIYDEELFYIDYGHANLNNMPISLKWYYYQNWKDLITHKSIFIEGYQYVSLSYVSLIQYLTRGLYFNQNKDKLTNYINLSFSPWLSFSKSKTEEFLINNQAQMNATLNNIGKSGIGNIIGGAMVGGAYGPIGAIAGIGATAIRSAIGIANSKSMQDAKLQDLANSPANTQDMSSASSFKIIEAENGEWTFKWISDIDKHKIWDFHKNNGYYLNKLLKIGTDIKSLSLRIFYNHWKISNMNVVAKDLNISNEAKNYFDTLFNEGFTFFNENVIIKDDIHEVEIGDYSKENWEVKLWDYLVTT